MNKDWTLAQMPSLSGRRAIVTGANSGIGYHTAAILARKGAEVVLACRDEQRGAAALTRLQREMPGTRLQFERPDLASLASVRAFCELELAQRRPLDILINNAAP